MDQKKKEKTYVEELDFVGSNASISLLRLACKDRIDFIVAEMPGTLDDTLANPNIIIDGARFWAGLENHAHS